jgi:hypothetical protein
MDTEHFIRIERIEGGCRRHFVVSLLEPGFSVEVIPEDAPGRRPAIRRVCLPNSWIGNYHRYTRLVAAAQVFLEKCDGLPRPGDSCGNRPHP